MAKLPTIKRLLTEDFKEQDSWIGNLLLPLNQFMETVQAALNSGLTHNENMDGQTLQLTVTGGQEPFFFKVTTKTKPRGVFCDGYTNLDNATRPQADAAVGLEWEYLPQTGQVKIHKVFGLKSGNKYSLEILVRTT